MPLLLQNMAAIDTTEHMIFDEHRAGLRKGATKIAGNEQLYVAATSDLFYIFVGNVGGIEELAKDAASRLAHDLSSTCSLRI